MFKIISRNRPIYYATDLSAGFDISAAADVKLYPGMIASVPTGLFIEAIQEYNPYQYNDGEMIPELQIRGRSGLAAKYGIAIANGVGTVDADFRDEIQVILINHSRIIYDVVAGDRIAQGVISMVFRPFSIPTRDLKREGGFGSTGNA